MGHTFKSYIVYGKHGSSSQKKRIQCRKKKRYAHHAYRNYNNNLDQTNISFSKFNQTHSRSFVYKNKAGCLFGIKHYQSQFIDYRAFALSMSYSQRIDYQSKFVGDDPQLQCQRWFKDLSRSPSDVILAANKQIQRRGQLKAFAGHRKPKQLYKRQNYFFM